MKQFDKYRMVDGVTPLAARYFNKVWQDIDLRLASLEEVKIAWQSAVDEVVKFGLVRIDELINEPLQAVLALSSQAERTSSNLEQLRQLAESRTAALAALIATLQADTTAQIQSFAAGLQNATAQSLQEWKDSQTAQLDAWMQTFEQELQAATDLLRNGNRKNLCPDVDSWDERATWQVSGDYKHWGLALTSSAEASTAGTILGPKIKVVAGDNYCISADSLLMATAGSVFVQLCFYDAGGTLLLTSGKKALAAGHDFSDAKERRDAHAVTAVAPASTAYLRPMLGWTAVAGLTSMGLRNVKVERGALPVTPYSQEAQVELLSVGSGSLTITSSQQISKSLFGPAKFVYLEMVGGGESGSAKVSEATLSGSYGSVGGGRGAPLVRRILDISDLPDLIDVVIGSGGAASIATRSTTGSSGNSGDTVRNLGGDSVFASLVAPGGGKDFIDANTGGGNMICNPPAGAGTINSSGLAVATYFSLFFGSGAAAKTNASANIYQETLTGNMGPVPGAGGGGCLNFVPPGNGGKVATAISGPGAAGRVTLKWW